MTLMLMDYDFILKGELPGFTGLTVKRAYYDTGSFKLTMKRGMPGWEKLEQGLLLFDPERTDTLLMIEKITLSEDKLVADGVPLKGLAKRRICVPPAVNPADDQYLAFGWDRFTGAAESAYLHFAANNLTACADTKRRLPRLTLAPDQSRGASLPWQARFDKLHELFKDIGEATEVGWDIRPDFVNKGYVFGAWAGRDLTAGTQRAALSRALGNVDGTTLTQDASAMVSTVYAGGSGEDDNRFIQSVGNDAEGLARREAWTDVSGAEDADMLRLGAERKLAAAKQTLNVEIRDTGLCRYGRDYDVGDKVTVLADGRQMNSRLIQMEETTEGGARKLKGTFGDAPVTLVGQLHRNGARPYRPGANSLSAGDLESILL